MRGQNDLGVSFMKVQRTFIFFAAQLMATSLAAECIFGLAEFNNELYVSRSAKRELEIYSPETLNLTRRLLVPVLGCVNDVASRTGCDVTFVVDRCFRQLHVIDQYGVRGRWPVKHVPRSASVTSSCNVLVTFQNDSIVQMYSPDGQIECEIAFQSDIGVLEHAIQLADNRFLVAHRNGDEMHRVILVDGQGRLLRSHGGSKGTGEFNHISFYMSFI